MVGTIQTTTAVPTAVPTALPACKQTTQEAANNIVAFKAPVAAAIKELSAPVPNKA